MAKSLILPFALAALYVGVGRARAEPVAACVPKTPASTQLMTATEPGCGANPVPSFVPLLEAPCPLRRTLAVPPKGAGVLFDAACARVYVLPPRTGSVSASQLTPTDNVRHCPDVLRLHLRVEKSLEQVGALEARIEAQLDRCDVARREITALQATLDGVVSVRAEAAALLGGATETLAQLTADAENGAIDLESCLLTASASACAAPAAAHAAAVAAVSTFTTTTYDPLAARSDAADAAYARAFDAFKAKVDELSTLLAPALTLADEIASIQRTVEATYTTYAALEGARGALRYGVGWEALRTAYRLVNPAAQVTFLPVPIESAKLSASTLIGGEPTELSALLWVKSPADGQGAEASALELLRRDAELPIQIGLSLLGACPFFPDGRSDVPPKDVGHTELAAYVVANLSYRYLAYGSDAYAESITASSLTAKAQAGQVQSRVAASLNELMQSTTGVQAYKADALDLTARHNEVKAQQAAVRKASADVIRLPLAARPLPPTVGTAATNLKQAAVAIPGIDRAIGSALGPQIPEKLAPRVPEKLAPKVPEPLVPQVPGNRASQLPEKKAPRTIVVPKPPPYRAVAQTGTLTFIP